jgi:hypothetical protein
MNESDKPMTKSEVLSILKVCGEDMEEQCKKISTLEKKVDNLQVTQNSILDTQNSILSMVESINKKLNDDKIEEKAYLSDKLTKIISNWIFWVAFVGTIAFAGMGVLKILDKADNISTIVKSVK